MRISILLSLALGVCRVESTTGESPPIPQPSSTAPPLVVSDPKAAEPAARAPAPERVRHEVEVEGHPVAVWEKSPPNPTGVLLLIHGRTWSAVPDFDLQVDGKQRSLMDALVAAGWSTYAVDLRGYGETPRDATGWLTPDRAAADVEAVLAWIAERRPMERKPALFGWSRGSMVAQLCAQRHPELISDLVLFGYPTNPDAKRKKASAPAEPPKRATTAKAAGSDFISPEVIDQATIDAYVAASLAADPVRTDWKDEHQFNALDPSKVSVPTLVMHGERDPYAPVSNQAKLFSRLGHPDRRWVILAGADHAAHLEDTLPQFLDGLLGFLERPTR